MPLQLAQKLQNPKHIWWYILFIDAHTSIGYDWAAKESSFDTRQRPEQIWSRLSPTQWISGVLSQGTKRQGFDADPLIYINCLCYE